VPEDIDEVTGVPGFGNAIESAGWVAFDRKNGGLTMPNFEEHNVSAIERSSSSAERQRRYRERQKAKQGSGKSDDSDTRNGDVTSDVTGDGREEKRREEKKGKPKQGQKPSALPDWLPPDAWADYLEMRKKIKKPPTERALELVLMSLETLRNNGHDVRAVLDQSILKNWIDVYPVREERRSGQRLGPEYRGQGGQQGDIYAHNRAVVDQMMAEEQGHENLGEG
jgi:hypothetical protein